MNSTDKRRLLAVLWVSFAGACDSKDAQSSSGAGGRASNRVAPDSAPERLPDGLRTFPEIIAGGASEQSLSLCHIIEIGSGGGGVFEVLTLGSREESTARGIEPYTYAQLRLLNSWYGPPPDDPVIRMYGGLSGGTLSDAIVGLRVGERLGLLLVAPDEHNAGYYGVFAQGAFRGTEQTGFSNGVHFLGSRMSLDWVGSTVRQQQEAPPADCKELLDQGVHGERANVASSPPAPPTVVLPDDDGDAR